MFSLYGVSSFEARAEARTPLPLVSCTLGPNLTCWRRQVERTAYDLAGDAGKERQLREIFREFRCQPSGNAYRDRYGKGEAKGKGKKQ